mmetsp:Transcript_14833/g.21217  ORF Transcript_14833/g.21217 Transcript_14833/m.21217 type:complete len:339 (-) Transcript_14833:120-1136(-)
MIHHKLIAIFSIFSFKFGTGFLVSTKNVAIPAKLTGLNVFPMKRASPIGKDNDHNDRVKSQSSILNGVASLAVAGTLLASSIIAPYPSHASTVDLSTGAIIIQTSNKQGQSIVKAEIDAKDLGLMLLKNRNGFKASLERIGGAINEELSSPAWQELGKEVLKVEGDVAPDIKFIPPNDVTQTLKDISKGKLNVIVNGEIINLSIDEKFSSEEDEVVIRAKGIKGVELPKIKEADTTSLEVIQKSQFQVALDQAIELWRTPLKIPALENVGLIIDNGAAILVSTASFVVFSYVFSYNYYLNQIEAERQAAEEKKKLIAAKKAKKAKEAKKEAEKVEVTD